MCFQAGRKADVLSFYWLTFTVRNDLPMRYFLFILFLHVGSIAASSQDDLFIRSTVERLKNAKDYSLKVAEAMPADKYDFRPTPVEMSFGGMLMHMAENLLYISTEFVSTDRGKAMGAMPTDSSKANTIKTLSAAYDAAIATVAALPKENLPDSVAFFAGKLTKMQMINILSDHQTHHRGQLIVYLRLNGILPPRYIAW
jgi:uncharacterized damage-inducible protein DinB